MTYTLTYDYENHLTAVSGGSVSASFVYDTDGNRVKGTVNGTTTVYIAGLYEYQGGATTLYYEGNALRRTGYAANNGVFYLLQDQLKSSSVLTNQNGTVNSRNYFYPFGGNRGGAVFSALTTKRFTGQYHEQGLPGGEGLSYYGARWYDAQVGRFLSADTLVPNPGNPQSLNRYSYGKNNPTGRIDPTGHFDITPGDDPWWNNTGSSSAANQAAPVNIRPSFWPSFIPYYFDLPVLTGQNIVPWISQNNIPTAIAGQIGVDSGGGFGFGGAMSFEMQSTFNWWSGELTVTYNNSAGARVGAPQLGDFGAHLGGTIFMGASNNIQAIVGAAKATSVDAQADAIAKAGVVGTWGRSYSYNDLNGDHDFSTMSAKFSEPMTTPYIDPVFHRTVDSLSINLAAGGKVFSIPMIANVGVTDAIADTNELYTINLYKPFQVLSDWASRK